MIVGGNGAGKTTFYEQFLAPKGMPFINADVIAKEFYPGDPESNSLKAAKLAEKIRFRTLQDGGNFCFETVFSHPSKIDFLAHAKSLGYQTHLIFIHVEHADLNVARVYQRVEEGGHSVPSHKIRARIPRTLDNVRATMPLCDSLWVFDNSSVNEPFKSVLIFERGHLQTRCASLPPWADKLVLDH